jgi:hypothetical protein
MPLRLVLVELLANASLLSGLIIHVPAKDVGLLAAKPLKATHKTANPIITATSCFIVHLNV